MATTLHELGAVDVLLRVGQSDRANPQLRLMCSTTLSFLTNTGAKSDKSAGSVWGRATGQSSAEAVDITRQLEEVRDLSAISAVMLYAHQVN
jgi:hypothetical protein